MYTIVQYRAFARFLLYGEDDLRNKTIDLNALISARLHRKEHMGGGTILTAKSNLLYFIGYKVVIGRGLITTFFIINHIAEF